MEILQVKNLTFEYPKTNVKALNNINLTFNEGDFCVIFGETGCGKSTLLKHLKREITPYGEFSGQVLYKGQDIKDCDKSLTSKIGFVMQNPDAQIVTDSVLHELCFGLEQMGIDSKTIRCRIAEVVTYFGIESLIHKKTSELSGGEKQLINLASILLMQPEILILDEPTSQLDPIAANEFILTLKKLNDELGITVIIVEHRLDDIFAISNKVVLMEKGKIIYDDTPQNIAEFYSQNMEHSSFLSLPTPMKIFSFLNGKGETPLTVKECRNFVKSNYSNQVKTLQKNKENIFNKEIIKVKNISFRYEKEGKDIIDDASFSVYDGEHLCILGGNGAGKTTLINIVAGLLISYKGKIKIQGKNIKDYKGNTLYRNNIALLPQNPQSLFVKDTVYDEIYETAQLLENDSNFSKEKIEKLICAFNIDKLLKNHPYDLSGGEQQKVALLKVLLSNPKILILDEPTKCIDAQGKKALADIIKTLQKEGVTVISVTHDVEFAAEYSDRCAMLFDGKIISDSLPYVFFSQNTFYTTSANRISRDYFDFAVTCDDVVKLCVANRGKSDE